MYLKNPIRMATDNVSPQYGLGNLFYTIMGIITFIALHGLSYFSRLVGVLVAGLSLTQSSNVDKLSTQLSGGGEGNV